MDQSRSVSASNASTLAGLLAMFNGGSSCAGADNDLFSALLSGTESTSGAPKDLEPKATAATASAAAFSSTGTASNNTLKALTDLAHTMHKIMSLLRRDSRANSNGAPPQDTKAQVVGTNAQTPSPTTTDSAAAEDEAGSVIISDANDAETSRASDVADVDLNNPQTLADVLGELVLLIQYIQQRLQELQTAQAEAAAGIGTEATAPETPLLDALAKLFGTQDSGNESTTADVVTDTGLVPHGILETLFRNTDKAAEKLAEALADRIAKVATGDTNEQADTADELAKLVDLGAEIRQALSAIRRIKMPEADSFTGKKSDEGATTPTGDTASLTVPSTSPAPTVEATDTAALNAVVVASSVTQKFSAAPAASAAKAAETMAHRVSRSETQTRAATAAATANTTSTVSNATSAAPISAASPSANTNADFDAFLSSGETFTRGANDNLRGFGGSEGVGATGSYTFSSTLSALRATNGGTTGLPSAVEQVVLHMNRCVKSGDTRISLQLQPGDLGKITVKLDVSSDGSVQGTVLADNPKTLEMLQKDSRSLERALQDAGLRAEPGSLEFNLSGQSEQNTAHSELPGSNGTVSAKESEDDTVVEAAAVAETYYIRPSGVNIRV